MNILQNASRLASGALGIAIILSVSAPASAVTAGSQVFSGIVVHVSTSNIKVENPKSKQTLGFELVPQFKQVFSSDGKTTSQMANVKSGRYVKVYYDQKFLGVRHADRIILLNNAEEKTAQQKG